MRKWITGWLVLTTAACSVSGGAQLNSQPTGRAASQLRDVNPDDLSKGSAGGGLDNLRFRAEVCQGVELRPDYTHLTAESFLTMLKEAGLESSVERAREDLIYVDVKTGSTSSRFRVATLPSAAEAGRHLHEALLEHGQGSWGVHRSNLAVLGPIGDVEQIVDFAATTKMCCWGVMTVAGRDDTFVVPGGYTEF